MAENAKQQALTLAQQEQNAIKERMLELTKSLEESQQDYEKYKREASARAERDRLQISSLHSEASRLKGQLEDSSSRMDGEKGVLEEKYRREKKSRWVH